MNSRILVFIVIAIYCISAKIFLTDNLVDKSVTVDDIIASPFILVETIHKPMAVRSAKTLYCKFQIADKNKRAGYSQFIKKYKNLVKKMIEIKIVPDYDMMVHSKIQIKFNASKRKWEISRHFVVIVENKDYDKVSNIFKKYQASQLKQSSSIRFLSEKFQVLEAFNFAKIELQSYLSTFKTKKTIEIIETKDIQISGSITNQQVLEDQIEYQANHSNSYQTEQIEKQFKNRGKKNKKSSEQKKILTIKVLFKVGIPSSQNNSNNKDSDYEDVSISNFQEQNQLNTNVDYEYVEEVGSNINFGDQNGEDL